ncbi:DUF192 domain-containing protein [Janthinobacterium agaricidamnosum]|uniref:Uncharacterized protein n=1 Tax=Janthinobacterium agaricidamnosum NBRC 102515 = DSM 9628 TaxID=1349767 RepID=W0VAF4_9BURK|nr:DUF192 domain-containing protein [Janthinobacterium agaricidamnosum]CDG84570.1 conserved hypothetical protein [Janthinobacterium agaricidamnosum NBRC 102515 = DSM 9628]
MKTFLAFLSASALLSASAQAQQSNTIQLSAGMHLIKAEVAVTEAQREQGLMFREKIPANAGMVFVFDSPATQCMWMKNTLVGLSVAFIDAKGVIINIEDMPPQTLDSHCSKKSVPVSYALEMNLGWFKQKNIKPGTVIGNLPRLP